MAKTGAFEWAVQEHGGERKLAQAIVDEYAAQASSWVEVARAFGVTRVTLLAWRRRLGIAGKGA